MTDSHTPDQPAAVPHNDLEPIQVSRSERLLSWILGGFIFLALVWGYGHAESMVYSKHAAEQAGYNQQQRSIDSKLDERRKVLEINDAPDSYYSNASSGGGRFSDSSISVQQDQIDELEGNLTVARERYRTELDAGTDDQGLRAKYRAADAKLTAAKLQLRQLEAANAAAVAKLAPFEKVARVQQKLVQKKLDADQRVISSQIFLLRAFLAFGLFGLSLLLMRRVAERAPRAMPAVQAALGATALLCLVMIIDYLNINFEWETYGPLGLALGGIALTLFGFWLLQRYLSKRRPARRLRSGECPRCGYPAGSNNYCVGCGNQLLTTCGECGAARTIGAHNCGACGN
ncbi:MAG: zinc ribbon domain-containing protein [Thermoleophilaceae bacterium]|nr:zinc ribbon domain-containing protein [Thermoleophilaceae bacterium]